MDRPQILMAIFAGSFFGTLIPILVGLYGWYLIQRIKGRSHYDIVMGV
jgi:hypothetical protein